MIRMLIDIHDNGFILEMDDGSKWTIEPYDVSICCSWTPTNEMKIQKDNNQNHYNITDLGSGLTVRAYPYAEQS